MSVLDKICEDQKNDLAQRKKAISLDTFKNSEHYHRKGQSLKHFLQQNRHGGIIAEFKRRSPSKPEIKLNARVTEIIPQYERAGAAAISILTNSFYFGGSSADLLNARALTSIPLLRKDFMVDAYQIHESKALGADVILLIAAALEVNHLKDLAAEAKSIGLEVLLEIKDADELEYIHPNVDFVGVNNRNLGNFEVHTTMSDILAPLIPDNYLRISESGLDDPSRVAALQVKGFQGFLIGEHFMRQANQELECARFVNALQSH